MVKLFLVICALFASTVTLAQGILLADGRDALLVDYKGNTICGKAKVDLSEEWVQIKSVNEFRVVEFEKIIELRLLDNTDQSLTSYHRYPLNDHESKLLEQVAIGSVHLLRKVKPQNLQTRMSSTYLSTPKTNMSKQYYLWNDGVLLKVKNFKKQLQSLMSDKEQQAVLEFQRQNKLSYNVDFDQVLVVNYLNQLRKEQLVLGH